MKQSKIDVLVADATKVFVDAGYTRRSVMEKVNTWNMIIRQHKENGHDYYDQQTVDSFIQNAFRRYLQKDIGRIRFRHLAKSAQYLSDLHEYGRMQPGSRVVPTGLSPHFESIVALIQGNREWSEKTRKSVRQGVLPYIKWIQAEGYQSVSQITGQTIRDYFICNSQRTKPNSRDSIRRLLKKFHAYLFSLGLINSDYSTELSFPCPSEHRIRRPVPQEEIAQVLSAIDRKTCKGKRDYAVILLATVLGLRAIDISELTFNSIDWINGELLIAQSKTGKAVSLPLTTDIGQALEDYILHGRPESKEPFVFLSVKSPAVKMGRTNPYQIFNEYRTRLGLPKASFHGLRRSVGTNLVIEGVPVTTIAQILGHSSIEPTKQYISLDSIHLKSCALPLPNHDLNEGGDLS